MTTLKQAVAFGAYRFRSYNCGYKTAAKLAGIPQSAMRYGRMVWQSGLYYAVMQGLISDQRVIGALAKLPEAVRRTIMRVETRLHRHLTRTRTFEIVQLFRKHHEHRLGTTTRAERVSSNCTHQTT